MLNVLGRLADLEPAQAALLEKICIGRQSPVRNCVSREHLRRPPNRESEWRRWQGQGCLTPWRFENATCGPPCRTSPVAGTARTVAREERDYARGCDLNRSTASRGKSQGECAGLGYHTERGAQARRRPAAGSWELGWAGTLRRLYRSPSSSSGSSGGSKPSSNSGFLANRLSTLRISPERNPARTRRR